MNDLTDYFIISCANLISLVLGVLLAILVLKQTLVIYHGPNSNQVKKEIDCRPEGCFRYFVEPVICPI